MITYVLEPPSHIRFRHNYATNSEEIKQLAIDRYWGTAMESSDRLKVVVDMFALIVTVTDPEVGPLARYKILEYERVIR